MADENPGWFKRFRFWIYRYDIELGVGFLVVFVSLKIVWLLDTLLAYVFTPYQMLMSIHTLLILFVVTVIMSNSARTRVATERLVEREAT